MHFTMGYYGYSMIKQLKLFTRCDCVFQGTHLAGGHGAALGAQVRSTDLTNGTSRVRRYFDLEKL